MEQLNLPHNTELTPSKVYGSPWEMIDPEFDEIKEGEIDLKDFINGIQDY